MARSSGSPPRSPRDTEAAGEALRSTYTVDPPTRPEARLTATTFPYREGMESGGEQRAGRPARSSPLEDRGDTPRGAGQ